MITNKLLAVDSTITEIKEEILPSSLNLKSRIFKRLQKMRGGYWDHKKFKDYFQINYFAIIYFIFLILFEIIYSIAKNNRRTHEEINIIRRKIEEPAMFKNYFESYPFSENSKFRA
jgi:hypothetical protein